jgi:bifunctional non-homologous end joining protein LigD
MKPFDKRLAMMVEDNPISYKDFEGEIPNILYDSDTVEIWDSGIYTPIDEKGNIVSEDDVEYAIETGNINFLLLGNKLKGEFALMKLHQDDDKAWLLTKQG